MGIRFSKSIKLGDLLKVNISKSGVSATVGKKGASINLGSKGTYLNLSPTIAGITGTGVSYRKKITGGYGSLLNKLNKKENNKAESKKVVKDNKDEKIIDEYLDNLENFTNVHKLSNNVLNNEKYTEKIKNESNDSIKQIYKLSEQGDEDTIESLVGAFLANLDFAYPVKANYELEDDVLYVDLDLPEFEQIIDAYPIEIKEALLNKKKSKTYLKKDYANIIVSLSIYLAAEFFNISPYIKTIILSGFITTRNKNGDLNDEYLYSIKYNRSIFENSDLSQIEDIYEFILKFENRINYDNSNYSFKKIKPFESKKDSVSNSIIDDTISALKELGYKSSLINEIIPDLEKNNFESASECLKEALKLLTNNK